MDPGSVGAVAGLGLLVLVGGVLCLYDRCVDRPQDRLPLAYRRPSHSRVRFLFPPAS